MAGCATVDRFAEFRRYEEEANGRFLGVLGFALFIPGVDDFEEHYSYTSDVFVIPKTSDSFWSEDELDYNRRAEEFARRYNKKLLRKGKRPNPNAEPVTILELRTKSISAEYGRRVRYSYGVLHYPEFIVRFDKRVEYRPPGTNLYSISYLFDVLDKKEKKVAGFEFGFSGLAITTATFEVSGKTFVAELTYTTAGQPVPREVPPKQNGELAEDEIVVWDESTARTGNLQLLEFWKKNDANPTAEPVSPSRGGSS